MEGHLGAGQAEGTAQAVGSCTHLEVNAWLEGWRGSKLDTKAEAQSHGALVVVCGVRSFLSHSEDMEQLDRFKLKFQKEPSCCKGFGK